MNITTIRKRNEENGFTFFDSERLKLTKAKVHPEVYSSKERTLFILECDDLFRRSYEIIYFDVSTGFCGRLEGTIGYSTHGDAKKYALKLTQSNKKSTMNKTTRKHTSRKTEKKDSLKPKGKSKTTKGKSKTTKGKSKTTKSTNKKKTSLKSKRKTNNGK